MKKRICVIVAAAILAGLTACAGAKGGVSSEEINSSAIVSNDISESTETENPPSNNDTTSSELQSRNTVSSESDSKSSVTDTDGKNELTESKISVNVSEETKTLVVYFSQPETTDAENMTVEEDNSVVVINGEVMGNTQYAAYVIQQNTGADVFRVEPVTPYPTEHDVLVDMAAKEQESNERPQIKDTIENFDDYSTVYIGYPIWWSDMPMIMYTFFDEYDLSGKTIIPFSTHGGSGLAGTVSSICELEPDANVYDNALSISRDDVQDAEQEITDWVNIVKSDIKLQ